MMNKAIFEAEWQRIRSQSTTWWSLMGEFDLLKVDKAEVKFAKYATLLQVKYGYTLQQAREEIARRWAEYEAKNQTVEQASTQVIDNKKSKTNGRSSRKAKTNQVSLRG